VVHVLNQAMSPVASKRLIDRREAGGAARRGGPLHRSGGPASAGLGGRRAMIFGDAHLDDRCLFSCPIVRAALVSRPWHLGISSEALRRPLSDPR
jgi:hypothetical protein